MMGTPPRTRFQTRSTCDGAKFWTLVVDAALAARFPTIVVASLVLGVALEPTKVLAIHRTLARVPGVVHTLDLSRSNLVDI